MEIQKVTLYQQCWLRIRFAKAPLAYWCSYALLMSVGVNAEKKLLAESIVVRILNKWLTKCLKVCFYIISLC